MAWALLIAAILFGVAAHAEYPEKPIELVVPFEAGRPVDALARAVGARLSERFGRAVTVENRSGSSTIIGTQHAALSRADGYTLVVFSSTHSMNAASGRPLPYDSLQDFTPIAMLGVGPYMLVVNPQMPSTLDGLLAKARSGETLSVATAGVGSPSHLTGALFGLMTGAKVTATAYKAEGPALVDVAAGTMQMSFASVVSALPYSKNGRLRGLAVTGHQRSSVVRALPTLTQAGLPGFDSTSWTAIFAPAGTPAPVVRRLNTEIAAIMDQPRLRRLLEDDGADVVKMSPEEVGAYFAADVAKWRDVIAKAQIKFE